jgi:CRISPR/Cas system-associated exonuclease Cas4 (RecB family)
MWAGEAVHNAVAEVLVAYRSARDYDVAGLRERVRQKMRDEWKSSRDRVYREPKKAKTCALFEHEYEIDVEDWKEVADHADACLGRFLEAPVHAELKALKPEEWLAIEELDSFELDGTKVHVKLDAAHRQGETIHIIDWKTSRTTEETDPFQLAVYALYAIERWRAAPDGLLAVEYNLSSGTPHERWVAPEEIAATREKMRAQIAEMKSLLKSDPAENLALEPDYAVTDDPKKCRRCNFQKVCPDRPK